MDIFDFGGNKYTPPTPLNGLVWEQIGDSLTALESGSGTKDGNIGFGTAISKRHGCKFVNNGTFGASWTVRNNEEYDSFCGVTRVDELLASNDLPDILTIALGTNDRENGETTDTATTTTTLYGAVRYCLNALKTNAPTLRLGVVIPPNRGTTNGAVDSAQKARNEIIKTVCREYAVPYVDMMETSGITPQMLSDGLHLYSDIIKDGMPVCRWFYMRALEQFLLTL